MNLLSFLLHFLWKLLSLLPFRLLYLIADGLYLVVCYVLHYRHRVIWNNLREAFPEKTEQELRQIEKGFYRWFCDYLVETVKLMTMTRTQLMKRMVFTGTELIDHYVDQGRSCGVYLGHYGQWEWITSLPYWLHSKGLCIQIYHPLENKRFDLLFQVPFLNNIHHWLPFLNHDTPVLTGTEKVMKATHQVVFYCDVSRVKRGYYRCEMRLITDEPQQHPDYALTDLYFRELERTIRRDPCLYLWSHNRWKRTREEFNLRYNKATGRVDLRSLDAIIADKHQTQTP